MANGVIYGRINALKETSLMLDDGQWYGDRELIGRCLDQNINVKDYVIISYWTKSQQHDGQWRNYRNIVAIRKVENCGYKQLGEYFSAIAQATLPEEGQHPRDEVKRAAAEIDDDDIPF